jgi:hypothetical protein
MYLLAYHAYFNAQRLYKSFGVKGLNIHFWLVYTSEPAQCSSLATYSCSTLLVIYDFSDSSL